MKKKVKVLCPIMLIIAYVSLQLLSSLSIYLYLVYTYHLIVNSSNVMMEYCNIFFLISRADPYCLLIASYCLFKLLLLIEVISLLLDSTRLIQSILIERETQYELLLTTCSIENIKTFTLALKS